MMAVLKSPRNSRKKSNWKASYALKHANVPVALSDKRIIRAAHNLHIFLRDYSHSVVTSLQKPRRIVKPKIRPNVMITYGRNSFDSTTTHPLILRKELRKTANKKRLFILINTHAML